MRKRAHFNFHPTLDDPIQRLCVSIEPETYIQPHRHADPDTCEIFIMLRGQAIVLFFDDEGRVVDYAALNAGGPVLAIEIPPRVMHTIASLEKGSIFFEVKHGPYVRPKMGNVALWAPAEGDSDVAEFVNWFGVARIGDHAPTRSGK